MSTSQALTRLLPEGISGAVVPIETAARSRFEQEHLAVAKSVAKRKSEFFAGREAARKALSLMGVPEAAIPVGERRAPQWPEGIVGAISHAGGVAAAVVSETFGGVGVDLERNFRVTQTLAARTRAPYGDSDPHAEAALAAQGICSDTLRFSAKEAGFKAYYPSTSYFLGFDMVSCKIDPETCRFTLDIQPPNAPPVFGQRYIQGAFCLAGEQVLTVAWVPRAA